MTIAAEPVRKQNHFVCCKNEKKSPRDKKVKATVIAIVEEFFKTIFLIRVTTSAERYCNEEQI